MPYADPLKQRDWQNKWMQERRRAWLKENGPCIDCHGWEELQVDHRDPSQKVSHRVWSWREDRRLKELAKCCARCLKCHKKKSAKERAKGEQHGKTLLTEKEVRQIRDLRTVMTYVEIAKHYGVTKSAINHVVNDRWRHIPR